MGLEVPWVAEEAEVVVGAPGFEGFEKRLEVEFTPGPNYDGVGLKAIARRNIDRMLKAADCTIVSKLSNEHFDSYVLSESSLFIYPLRIIIKTCGTTKLLRSIPVLLELASGLGLSVRCCKYRRGTFFFPAEQVYPHGSFTDEVEYLNRYFGSLGSGGRGYVLGNPSSTHKWHVYLASVEDEGNFVSEPTFTLEMCMTNLSRKVAAQFYKDVNGSALEMTEATGIDGLLPEAKICDYAFEPCGYSMNSVEAGAYSTIHVTPEEACSYASFETMGYGPGKTDLKTLVEKVLGCFEPGFFSVSVYASGVADSKSAGSWGSGFCPAGYYCVGSSRQELGGGDVVVYHTFKRKEFVGGCEVAKPVPMFGVGGGGIVVAGMDPKLVRNCSSEIEKLKNLKNLAGHLACSVQRAA